MPDFGRALIIVLMNAILLCVGGRAFAVDPPGVAIDYSPASAEVYIGSPSIAVLPNGDYAASHDYFGPKTTEHSAAVSRVFGSSDRGKTWKHLSDIKGAFWSSLFVHRGALYFMGTYKHYGSAVIRRSDDGGRTWTDPKDENTGLLATGQYHCAPMPVIEHNGRLWRAMEFKSKVTKDWGGEYFCSCVFSIPADADLLKAKNWQISRKLAHDASWPGRAWLEGNVVVGPDGNLVNILRLELRGCDKAALINISEDGKTLTFDPAAGVIDFPGGSNKFAIRHDRKTNRYWSLVNKERDPAAFRNVLALSSSEDLRSWRVEGTILRHPDPIGHAWQYVDWLFDGDDIIAVSRTAWDNAHRAHDANYLTFHRIENFRRIGEKSNH